MAELTWENGQLVMHGFGFPRTLSKPSSSSPIKSDCENPRVGGTLECIVDRATCPPPPDAGADDHFTWFHHHCTPADTAIDVLVPCSTPRTDAGAAKNSSRVPCPPLVASSTMVGSCSGAEFDSNRIEEEASAAAKYTRWAAPESNEISSHMFQSTTYGSESHGHVETETTWDMDLDVDFTSTSHEYSSLLGMPMPLSSHSKPTNVYDGHDSVCHTKPQAYISHTLAIFSRCCSFQKLINLIIFTSLKIPWVLGKIINFLVLSRVSRSVVSFWGLLWKPTF